MSGPVSGREQTQNRPFRHEIGRFCVCSPWVQLPLTPQLAEPVHDEAALAEVAARVREAVG